MKSSGQCVALAFALAAYGCNGDQLTIPSDKGILEVSTTTSGIEPDADGYTVQVAGGPPQPIGTAATWTSGELDPGNYAVELGGVSPNCSVAENPRNVTVIGGEASTVAFQVTCGATTGGLEISTATSGTSPDADGYAVTVDGTDRGAIQPTGALSLVGLSPGDHLVGLSGVAGNCTVEGENPRTVSVTAGSNGAAAFAIACTTPPADAGTLRITTTTQGPDQDSDGYAFTVDGGSGQPIGTNAQATLVNIAAGQRSVRLSGLASNCSVAGDNPRAVTVASAAMAEVSFTITCGAVSGSILVNVTSSGEPADPDGYTVTLDNQPSKTVEINGSVGFTGAAPGSHTIALSGIAANCTVTGGASQAIQVTAGQEAGVAFQVACTATTGSIQVTTSTSGVSVDPDGYTVTLQGGAPQSIGVNGTVTISDVAAGQRSLTLAGLAANCTVEGVNPRTVSVAAGSAAQVSFAIVCTTPRLTWRLMESGTTTGLSDVAGSSGTDVFAVGASTILHYDGQRWSQQPASGDLRSVWSNGPSDAFAVGLGGVNGIILHYDGTSWSEMEGISLSPPGGQINFYLSVWGSSHSDVFAVGEYLDVTNRGLIAHYDGTAWAKATAPNEDHSNIQDVFGTSSSNVYAVGYYYPFRDDSFVLRYDGSAWNVVHSIDPGFLTGVWSSSPSDVFVVGSNNDAGIILHYDGINWSPMTIPPTGILTGVWGSSASDVYAVRSDAILHYDGTSWTKVSDQGGFEIWGSSASDVFVVGAGGKILHGTP
jgi:hypothetical protein